MTSFQPQWASPPGDTISYLLRDSNRDLKDLCSTLGLTYKEGSQLISGSLGLDSQLAAQLAHQLGSSEKFWLKRESQYREDLARSEKRLSREAEEWMRQLPLSDMVKRRWIKPGLRGKEKLGACLEYFGVDSYTAWKNKYENLMYSVSFRTSHTFDSKPEAVLAWLRQGECQAEMEELMPWSQSRFYEAVKEARGLTRVGEPASFLPILRSLFGKCGVAVAVAPVPKGCRASGAVFFTDTDRAVILLSFRYLSDDHFWFTLFHECAHLLLHSDQEFFLEGKVENGCQEESEANAFSAKFLIPPEYEDELYELSKNNLRGILKFAKKLDISPGIVVGQMQHKGIVRHQDLNRLKVRYKWTT